MTADNGQDKIYNLLTKHPLTDGSSGYVLPIVELLAIQDAIARHTQEAVARAEEGVAEWFDEGVPSGYTAKDWLAAYHFAKSQAAPQQSTSPDGEKKDGDE